MRQVGALQALIASRITADRRWQLTPDTMDELADDLGDLLERVDYSFRDEVLDVLLEHAEVFFSDRDLAAIAALEGRESAASPAARRAFEAAVERAYTRILPMWSFVILLCRELQKGDASVFSIEAEYRPDGSLGFSISNRGNVCTGRHLRPQGPQNDLVRTFERQ